MSFELFCGSVNGQCVLIWFSFVFVSIEYCLFCCVFLFLYFVFVFYVNKAARTQFNAHQLKFPGYRKNKKGATPTFVHLHNNCYIIMIIYLLLLVI